MRPGIFDWPAQYAGDTAGSQSFTITRNELPIDLTGAVVRMQVRECGRPIPILSLSSAAGGTGIVIVDAPNGMIRVGYFRNPPAPGAYVYDLEVTFADGTVKTYLRGSYTIDGEVTQ